MGLDEAQVSLLHAAHEAFAIACPSGLVKITGKQRGPSKSRKWLDFVIQHIEKDSQDASDEAKSALVGLLSKLPEDQREALCVRYSKASAPVSKSRKGKEVVHVESPSGEESTGPTKSPALDDGESDAEPPWGVSRGASRAASRDPSRAASRDPSRAASRDPSQDDTLGEVQSFYPLRPARLDSYSHPPREGTPESSGGGRDERRQFDERCIDPRLHGSPPVVGTSEAASRSRYGETYGSTPQGDSPGGRPVIDFGGDLQPGGRTVVDFGGMPPPARRAVVDFGGEPPREGPPPRQGNWGSLFPTSSRGGEAELPSSRVAPFAPVSIAGSRRTSPVTEATLSTGEASHDRASTKRPISAVNVSENEGQGRSTPPTIRPRKRASMRPSLIL
ncbi:MAG: hypothetical protein Q9208_007161 [Pyrenodesmia sp. 3 TL-2023]